MAETFEFGDGSDGHEVGNPNCPACWSVPAADHDCGTIGCLEHTCFGDYSSYESYWLHHLGDLCREN